MKIYYIERLGFNENDNLINYTCGPFEICLYYCSKEIMINYFDVLWDKYTPTLINVLCDMLELHENQINKHLQTITIINLTPSQLERYFLYTLTL